MTAQLLTSIGTHPHTHTQHHQQHHTQQQGTKASDNLASLAFLASVEMRQSPAPTSGHYPSHSNSNGNSSNSLASLLSPTGSVLPSVSSSTFSSSSGLHKLLSAASETPFAPPSDANPFRPSPHTPSSREAAVRHSTSPSSSSSSSSYRDNSSLSHNHPHQTPSKHHAHAEPASPPSPESSSSSSGVFSLIHSPSHFHKTSSFSPPLPPPLHLQKPTESSGLLRCMSSS
eukprot:TRINITY_DN966_c1_g1_i4.p1 TRINITY_DN966_c1_g1~~TRINITY_DN966_c1_g1_i4.p1  ORF type:complete len:229 (-),score=69.29 TRINITY_DN966_c1_g1_i4:642-1328(-)